MVASTSIKKHVFKGVKMGLLKKLFGQKENNKVENLVFKSSEAVLEFEAKINGSLIVGNTAPAIIVRKMPRTGHPFDTYFVKAPNNGTIEELMMVVPDEYRTSFMVGDLVLAGIEKTHLVGLFRIEPVLNTTNMEYKEAA